MPHLSFPCKGTLHAIEYYASSMSSTDLNVWRWSDDGETAILVHIISLIPQKVGIQILHLNHTLNVQESDFIGIRNVNISHPLGIPFAQANDPGILGVDLQDAYILDLGASTIDTGQLVVLGQNESTKLVLALNIHYSPSSLIQGMFLLYANEGINISIAGVCYLSNAQGQARGWSKVMM